MRATPLILILAAALAPAEEAVKTPAQPPSAGRIAFNLREKDLIPAGLARDPATGAFFIGSNHKRKIVTVVPGGEARDFATRGQDGLWTIPGLRVDAERRHLWAMTSGHRRLRQEKGLAGAFKYDLGTGRLIGKYLIEDGSRRHFFNDLAITRAGEVFITDTDAGAVYRITPQKNELERFTEPGTIRYPNGITLSDDEKHLFVSHSLGILVIDAGTKEIRDIRTLEGVPLVGVDGLCFYRGSLVAVQSGAKPERIMRFFLSPSLDRVERAEILDKGNPHFDIPTTGVLAGDTFYYIANSQMGSFDEVGRIFPLDKLHEPVILELKLAP